MIPAVIAIIIVILVIADALRPATAGTRSDTSGRPPNRGRPPFARAASALFASKDDQTNVTAQYRPRSGSGDYSFRFLEVAPESFRIYVLRQPDRWKPAIGSTPHLLADSRGSFICWTVAITSYDDAKEIAARWAEAVEEFRETGKSF